MLTSEQAHDIQEEHMASNHQGVGEYWDNIVKKRMSRRSFVTGLVVAVPLALVSQQLGKNLLIGAVQADSPRSIPTSTPGFIPIELSDADNISVAQGYLAAVLIKWGDPLSDAAPSFNLLNQTPQSQRQQFGYNADFIGYFPLENYNSGRSDWGLLAVNHEYTNPELMFPNYDGGNPTDVQVNVELAAHGMTLVEVIRETAGWRYNRSSSHNRRITAETEMVITGPAAGHDLLKTGADPNGNRVLGMLNNCAGGKTPWGTVLTCEENFNQYFANADALEDSDERKGMHQRYGLPGGESDRKWERFHERFDISKHPNEPFRFGWVVEIDPYDPDFEPRKRTALGRTKHEGAPAFVADNGRVVVYSGDDQRFDYMYKFVTSGAYDASNRAANRDLLDSGTLYVAKFSDNGTGEWIPLVQGQGPLTEANGFANQGDVLIKNRQAGDAVGATMMDRPEDIEVNPVNKKVYCLMTNNTQRGTEGQPGPDAANPRPENQHGHVIELTEAGDDHTATTFTWEIFMLCGDPNNPDDQTFFGGADPSGVSPISSPDNLVFDNTGNLWIATDGQINTFGKNDGIYMVPTEGPSRGGAYQFFSGVPGGEVCGPEFTMDNETLFCAIQHPGEDGTLADPISSWPDGMQPPRPSVVVITKSSEGSKVIGT